ncbi:hypothetical protein AB6V54_18700, partial [Stenotrophomonas maltophilia]
RERHAAARKLLAEGVDPGEQRKAQKVASLELVTNTFEALAREHLVAIWAPGGLGLRSGGKALGYGGATNYLDVAWMVVYL